MPVTDAPDAEQLLISWGNDTDALEEPFFGDVPRPRPRAFYTVERTGGPVQMYRDLPTVAVQAWARSRDEARQMILSLREAVWSELVHHSQVARVEVNAVSHFPGPNGEPRYQAVLELVTA